MGNFKQKELTIVGLPTDYEPKQEQEISYSEEEVLNIIDNFCETFKVDLILREDFNQWFDQFKNN